MTISHKTALLGVDDLKIFPITNDSEESFTVSRPKSNQSLLTRNMPN